jgi:molybdenum cofactor cytidylyltransferase
MISAIVLAAGQSRRMGTQKLVLPFHGKPMIAAVVDQLLNSPVDEIVVVTSDRDNSMAAALAGRDVRIAVNKDRNSEMLQSVRCGLTAASSDSEAVIVALGDQPTITSNVVRDLLRAYHSTGHRIVVPSYAGKRGHPLLISTQHRDEILNCHDQLGLRALLAAHPQDVFELPVNDAGVLEDVDIPDDYQRVLGREKKS